MRLRAIAVAAACAIVTGASVVAAGQIAPRGPGQVTLALTGLSTFKGELKGTCTSDAPNNRVTVEGAGPNDLFIRLSVAYPKKGPFKVMMEGLGGGKGQTVGRVSSLVVNKHNYIASAGSGTLNDAAGKVGTLRAEGFIQAGASMQTVNLTANVTWKCQ